MLFKSQMSMFFKLNSSVDVFFVSNERTTKALILLENLLVFLWICCSSDVYGLKKKKKESFIVELKRCFLFLFFCKHKLQTCAFFLVNFVILMFMV